ncbi:hypothetical protein EDF81_3011 [Enterobacter sp. BIGb0383]|uniref:hypothetical protein n=1 Tax=unclassified Enterobacter TaxID=2608935 RepID=UPI000F4862C9|nr:MULTISPECIES: hypothetical protein [unclassified Enterobacter]ROP60171.1 hypothetical protein EDF81_3011 [Enterobacter sp. BIGb0383]ROS08362.1 hypothetical protein EC848_1825 [Enterobacter sp. BIGb0359]
MKLTGSRTENIKRDELINSGSFIRGNKVITGFLNDKYGHINSVYVLAHTPEQGEDIYRVLINGILIVGFELSKSDNQVNEHFDMSVADYSKQLKGRLDKLELAVALDLADKH